MSLFFSLDKGLSILSFEEIALSFIDPFCFFVYDYYVNLISDVSSLLSAFTINECCQILVLH